MLSRASATCRTRSIVIRFEGRHGVDRQMLPDAILARYGKGALLDQIADPIRTPTFPK